jgi:hypothetical protein
MEDWYHCVFMDVDKYNLGPAESFHSSLAPNTPTQIGDLDGYYASDVAWKHTEDCFHDRLVTTYHGLLEYTVQFSYYV